MYVILLHNNLKLFELFVVSLSRQICQKDSNSSVNAIDSTLNSFSIHRPPRRIRVLDFDMLYLCPTIKKTALHAESGVRSLQFYILLIFRTHHWSKLIPVHPILTTIL